MCQYLALTAKPYGSCPGWDSIGPAWIQNKLFFFYILVLEVVYQLVRPYFLLLMPSSGVHPVVIMSG